MKDERTEVVGPAAHACAACPWRESNHRRRHAEGWYTDANRRRLWNGIRTGEAPGMTCHPTDPQNQPVGDKTVTRECAGVWLLLAREQAALEAAKTFAEYRRGRKLAVTRGGFLEAMSALLPRPFGRGLRISLPDDADVRLGLGTGR